MQVVYFDIKGKGEPIRLLFFLSGIDFEDVRMKPDEFMERKANNEFPYGQLPLVT